MKLLLFTFLAPLASGFEVTSTSASLVSSSETVSYTCLFQNHWSGSRHPVQYPGNAHWSPPVLAAHNSGYSMWEEGGISSAEVELVAETGSPSLLQNELASSPDVKDFVTGTVTFNSEVQMQTFEKIEMDSDKRYMSTITMIAPSPDWFSGFYNFEAVNSDTETWYRSFIIDTYPWDAGTENGDGYSTANQATSPQDPISRFTTTTVPANGVLLNSAGDAVLPVATWACSLEQEDPQVNPQAVPVPSTCFSGENTVEVEGKGLIPIGQLEIGDNVNVGADSFERVYSFGHYSKTGKYSYLQIYNEDTKPSLEISKDHMLFVENKGKKKSVPASTVKVGDSMVMNSGDVSRVSKVKTVIREGAFAPFTMSGKIVVNGVVSSSYVSLQGTDTVMIGGIKTPFAMHFVAHLLTAPLRMMARVGLLSGETYNSDGLSNWIAGPYYLTELLLEQNPFLFGFVFALMAAFSIPFLIVEAFLANSALCFAVGVGATWYYSASKKVNCV